MDFCEKCGSKVSNDDKFCQSCGASLKQSSETGNQLQTSETEPLNQVVKKKKKRWPILVASLIFIFVLGGVSWAFFGISDAKMDYLKAESNTIQEAYKEWSTVYGDVFALADKMSNESYEQTLDLSANVSSDAIPEVELIQEILESVTLQAITKQDMKNEQHEMILNFLMNNDILAGLSMYQSNDQTALKLPFVNDPIYYFLENNKFGEFVRKYDPAYSGPENIKELFDFKEQLETGLESEYKDLFKDYGMFLITELDKENFSKEKNVQYDGKSVDKITLTLTDEEIKTLITGVLDKIENDEKLFNLLMKQAKVALIDQTEEDYKQELKAGLTEGIAEIKSGLENVSFGSGLVSTLYVNSSNLIIARDFSLVVTEASSDDEAVEISYVVNSKEAEGLQFERKLSIKPVQSDVVELAFEWNTNKEKNNDIQQGTNVSTMMKFILSEYGYESVNLGLKMDTTRMPNEAVTDFVVETEGDFTDGRELAISGQLSQKIDQDLSKNYANGEAKLSLTIGMDDGYGYEELTIHLNADTKTEFTNELDFPNLQADGARNISEMSEEEWFMIIEEISTNVQEMMYNMDGFGF